MSYTESYTELEPPHSFAQARSYTSSVVSHSSSSFPLNPETPPLPHINRQIFPLLNSLYSDPQYLATIAQVAPSKYGSLDYPSYRDSTSSKPRVPRKSTASTATATGTKRTPSENRRLGKEKERRDKGEKAEKEKRDKGFKQRKTILDDEYVVIPQGGGATPSRRHQSQRGKNHLLSDNGVGIRHDASLPPPLRPLPAVPQPSTPTRSLPPKVQCLPATPQRPPPRPLPIPHRTDPIVEVEALSAPPAVPQSHLSLPRPSFSSKGDASSIFSQQTTFSQALGNLKRLLSRRRDEEDRPRAAGGSVSGMSDASWGGTMKSDAASELTWFAGRSTLSISSEPMLSGGVALASTPEEGSPVEEERRGTAWPKRLPMGTEEEEEAGMTRARMVVSSQEVYHKAYRGSTQSLPLAGAGGWGEDDGGWRGGTVGGYGSYGERWEAPSGESVRTVAAAKMSRRSVWRRWKMWALERRNADK